MKMKFTLLLVVISLCGSFTFGQDKPAKAPEALTLEISKDVSLPINLVTPSTPAACGKE
jgi:hypothetical protein